MFVPLNVRLTVSLVLKGLASVVSALSFAVVVAVVCEMLSVVLAVLSALPQAVKENNTAAVRSAISVFS